MKQCTKCRATGSIALESLPLKTFLLENCHGNIALEFIDFQKLKKVLKKITLSVKEDDY